LHTTGSDTDEDLIRTHLRPFELNDAEYVRWPVFREDDRSHPALSSWRQLMIPRTPQNLNIG